MTDTANIPENLAEWITDFMKYRTRYGHIPEIVAAFDRLIALLKQVPKGTNVEDIPELVSQCEEAFNDLVRLNKALLPARRLILD
jgi:hypothetical protein